jgi:hypothetical protein
MSTKGRTWKLRRWTAVSAARAELPVARRTTRDFRRLFFMFGRYF